jgi:hypothetical protein
MDALEALKQEFFAVVQDRPEERWDAFKAQFDDLVRQVSETALLSLATEAAKLREMAKARPAEEVEPKELLFGLPTILDWRAAQALAGAAVGVADARQPESLEVGSDEEFDLYQALWVEPSPNPLF